jgi:hypothetical protein
VLLALAVMLLAVLPHATLAASTIHAAPVLAARPAQHHDAAHAGEASPCHDAGEPFPAATHAMPPCCILGCGMLAGAPQPPDAPRLARWRLLPPDIGNACPSATVEPAERPPRSDPAGFQDAST